MKVEANKDSNGIFVDKELNFSVPENVSDLFKELYEQYEKIPATTCANNQVCCKAGNPHMTYLEFLNVNSMIENEYSEEQRVHINLECLKRYIWTDLSKPCLFLKEKGCSIYHHRQFNCRFYGIVPKEEYERRSKDVQEKFFAQGQSFPLAKQCPFVKTADGSAMTPARYNKIIDDIRDLDKKAGMSRKDVNNGETYHTFHDWWMLFYYGPDTMADFTEIRLKFSPEQKDKLLNDIASQLKGSGE
jgi:Fe-S-cluster containining protein